MHTEAFIFDYDGVLFDTVAIKGRAFAALFDEHGPEFTRRVVAHHHANGGMGRFEKFREYLSWLGLAPDDQHLHHLSERFVHASSQALKNSEPIPGAEAFLTRARAAGLRLFVVSGAPEHEVRSHLGHRGWATYFEGVYGTPPKKVERLHQTLLQHTINPARAVYFGDSHEDERAASANGVPFFAVNFKAALPSYHPAERSAPDFSSLALECFHS